MDFSSTYSYGFHAHLEFFMRCNLICRIFYFTTVNHYWTIILDEDDEISYSNEVIELLLKTILKSSSNKHDETQSGYFIAMITDLFLEGQFNQNTPEDGM